MLRRELLLSTSVVVASMSLVACQKSATIGGFVLDVPSGWYSETEDDTLAVGTKHAEWTFVMLTFTGDQIEGDDKVEAVGNAVAEELTRKDSEDDVDFAFTDTKTWTENGLAGILLDGYMSGEGLTIKIKMLVVTTGDRYLVAFGFRSPDAQGKHDSAAQAMLESIRAGK